MIKTETRKRRYLEITEKDHLRKMIVIEAKLYVLEECCHYLILDFIIIHMHQSQKSMDKFCIRREKDRANGQQKSQPKQRKRKRKTRDKKHKDDRIKYGNMTQTSPNILTITITPK